VPRETEPKGVDLAGLRIGEWERGSRFDVRVQPSAHRKAILGVHDGALKVTVTAPPERGRANAEVEELLAAALGLARGRVSIASGHGSRRKTVHVSGVSPADLMSRLRAI